MVSFSKLNRNIEIVRKYLKILDDFKIDSVEELENNMKDYLAISMSCFTILNAVIEIGEGLIDLKDLEFPSTYKEIFQILKKNKILSDKLAKDLQNYMYQRNMLAHQYDDVDINKVYELYIKRDVFNKFLTEVKKVL